MSFVLSRRRFLATAPLLLAPRPPAGFPNAVTAFYDADRSTFPDFNTLADAALSSAKSAGATYADVHLRVARFERIATVSVGDMGELRSNSPGYTIEIGFGVRALVNGYWGHSGADGAMTPDIAAQMGKDAVGQANYAAKGKVRLVELASMPVASGTWTMPVEIDPFTVSYEEKYDFVAAMVDFIGRLLPGDSSGYSRTEEPRRGMLQCMKDDRAFASTEGSMTHQTTFWTEAGLSYYAPTDWMSGVSANRTSELLSVGGAGWEYVRKVPYREQAVNMIEQARAARRKKPVNIGRYDIVFDAKSMARMVDQTIGSATELDRAMGYHADSRGTSYLDKPLEMLGTYKVGSPLLTVQANRTMIGGAATVKWDDEGVEPHNTTLVTNGVLTDYQTTRETANWLASYYQKAGRPVRSNGNACAFGTEPMQSRLANLVMQPSPQEKSFDELVGDVKQGLAVVNCGITTDFQVLNGTGIGEVVFEIENGQISGAISNAEISYRTPDFWKNLAAVGGARSAQNIGFSRDENVFEHRRTAHTVAAVPAIVKNVPVLEARRWR